MHIIQVTKIKKRKKFLLSLLVMALMIPGLLTGTVSGVLDSPSENRKLADFPSLPKDADTLEAFPKLFDRYISDHFGFRSDLVQFYNWLKFSVLSTSPTEKVIVGKKGWLFKYNKEQKVQKQLPELLLRKWRIHFEERRDWLREHGAEFLVVVASNKHTIYPEYLPDYLHPHERMTKLEQFKAYMAKYPEAFKLLDLTPRLKKEKSSHLLYYKTDTHWNYLGAYFGYLEIVAALPHHFPSQDIFLLDKASVTWKKRDTNLYQMMGVHGSETVAYFAPQNGWPFTLLDPDTDELKRIARRGSVRVAMQPDDSLPNAVIIGDSYLGWNQAFLAKHFHRAVFVNLWGTQWRHEETFPLALFKQESPDLVIMQFKESRLGFCPRPYCIASRKQMMNPADVRQARLRRLFAQAQGSARVVFARPIGNSNRKRGYEIDLASEMGSRPSSAWIGEFVIGKHAYPVHISVVGKKKGRCAKFSEVQETVIPPDQDRALLCLDGGRRLIRVELRNADGALLGEDVRLLAANVQLVVHPDMEP